MDEFSWARVKSVLAEALEQEPPQRQAFVDEACAGDEAVRNRVL